MKSYHLKGLKVSELKTIRDQFKKRQRKLFGEKLNSILYLMVLQNEARTKPEDIEKQEAEIKSFDRAITYLDRKVDAISKELFNQQR